MCVSWGKEGNGLLLMPAVSYFLSPLYLRRAGQRFQNWAVIVPVPRSSVFESELTGFLPLTVCVAVSPRPSTVRNKINS